jgi:hypothetical protein
VPATLEWHAVAAAVALGGLLWWPLGVVAVVMLLLALGVAAVQAAQARLAREYDGIVSRVIVAGLCYAQPLRRSWKRYRTWLVSFPNPGQPDGVNGSAPALPVTGSLRIGYWSEEWRDRTELLNKVVAYLAEHRWATVVDSGWSAWDAEVSGDRWTAVRVCTAQEDHGSGKRLIRLRYRLRFRGTLHLIGWAAVAGAGLGGALDPFLGIGVAAAAVSFLGVVWWRGLNLAGRLARVVDLAARQMNLVKCDNP